jgi:predicted MFS family arabinose efflux permease
MTSIIQEIRRTSLDPAKKPISGAEALQGGAAGLSDPVAFWSVGAILSLFLVGSAAPSPLYQIYAARWHFSSLTLTVVFALYAVALLASLLVTGRLSDHVGRRPVVLASIVVLIASMVCFIAANSVAVLIAARVFSGLATGCAVSALTAYLTELADGRRVALAPVVASLAGYVGLAVGALVTSVLVQYAPSPLRLVYWVLLVMLVVSALSVVAMRETGERRPGTLASLEPVAAIPTQVRPTFAAALAPVIGLWALSGFYLSLGPGLLSRIVGSANLLWGGAVVVACWGSAAISGSISRRVSSQSETLFGCIALLLGVVLTFVAIAASTASVFLVGCVVAGVGLGPAWLGSFRAVSVLASDSELAGTVAALYIVSYSAFSIPIVIAGVATTHFGVHSVALVYSAVIGVLAAIGVVAELPAYREHRRRAQA